VSPSVSLSPSLCGVRALLGDGFNTLYTETKNPSKEEEDDYEEISPFLQSELTLTGQVLVQ
jgi:hypothetical protein